MSIYNWPSEIIGETIRKTLFMNIGLTPSEYHWKFSIEQERMLEDEVVWVIDLGVTRKEN